RLLHRACRHLAGQHRRISVEGPPRMLRFRAPQFPDYLPLTEFLSGSRRVVLLGATLGSLSSPARPENAELLNELAQAGVPMTFGLVDPDAPPHVHESLAAWLGASPEDVRRSL